MFHNCEFLWINCNPCSQRAMSEVLFFTLKEWAFLQFKSQPIFCKSREHYVLSLEFVNDSGREDKDIIHVPEQGTDRFLVENCLHQSLEGGRCITQSKCHPLVSYRPNGVVKAVLCWSSWYLCVGQLQVQCAQPSGTCQCIHRHSEYENSNTSLPHKHNSTGKVTLAFHNGTCPYQSL